ncbi:hypothetical protein SAMN04488522_11072 [Pedobacter caeni]|uniref:DUF4402 domain-containing protein n=1 Tax=Pedobacter caeni TaxID=288992 RepID=A0A1M5PS18_9SPHI|nr:hypothetical protein SAMN04488522_11072 [Pedobacter caeni]
MIADDDAIIMQFLFWVDFCKSERAAALCFMKYLCLLIFFFCFFLRANAQPPAPAVCNAQGSESSNKLTVVSEGTLNFTLGTLNSFETAQTYSNNIRLNVLSRSARYKVYIAAELSLSGSPSTAIPLTNFQVLPVLVGTNPQNRITVSNVNLSGAYQQFAQRTNATGTSGDVFDLTVKLSGMNTYTQAPGNYTLKFHYRLCHY